MSDDDLAYRLHGGIDCDHCHRNHPITWNYCPYEGGELEDKDE